MKTKQKEEALKRLHFLNLQRNVIRDFENEELNLSEPWRFRKFREKPVGILFWLNDEEKQMVQEIEKKRKIMVYHVIKSKMEFGILYDCLYVSSSPEEWKEDMQDLRKGYPLVYSYDGGYMSEFGLIGIISSGGGLVRKE